MISETRAVASDADAWTRALDVVRTRFGHDVPERRKDAFRRAVVEAYVASGEVSFDAYLGKVTTASLESSCVAELVSRITVKESYFFRDELLTATLRELVLPRLVVRASLSKQLSIWSAGSSNGEEPYTLAILLDALVGACPSLSIRIVGTDLDEAALRFARAGEYGEWSIRTLPKLLRERYFEPRGTKFVLRDRYRRWVRFEAHNLADPEAPPPDPGEFDLVLCRNVAIYLSEDATSTLYAKLARSLKPGGLVVTAPSDPRPPSSTGLDALMLREGPHVTVVYAPESSPWRRPGHTKSKTPEPSDPADTLPPTIPAPPRSNARLPECAIPPSAPLPSDWRREEALQPDAAIGPEDRYPTRELAEQAIARAPLDAAPYFALALLEIERDAHDSAEAALKKVIYLAPHLAEAHYRLGLLRVRRGDVRAARRSFWNALDALEAGEDKPTWAASLGVCLAELEQRR